MTNPPQQGGAPWGPPPDQPGWGDTTHLAPPQQAPPPQQAQHPGYGQTPYGQPGQPGAQGQPALRSITVVTTETIAGRQVTRSLGEVIGVATRSREIGRKENPDTAYPALLLRSRQEAVAKMIEMAQAAGADAVVGLAFDSSEITQTLSEVVAYGTAVELDRP